MALKVAFDTNILVYAANIGTADADREKSEKAAARILSHSDAGYELFVAAQVLVELFDVLVRKGGCDRAEAAAEIDKWCGELTVMETNEVVLQNAAQLATRHRLRIFDSVIFAAAAEARCDQLLSEDFQHGFGWRGVEVINPFVDA